eukprot:3115406-Heterocapsa_arctica.AAC.1
MRGRESEHNHALQLYQYRYRRAVAVPGGVPPHSCSVIRLLRQLRIRHHRPKLRFWGTLSARN